jgi:glyoxylase-like metal-dependent hydrolase (beta-lactamase superfamily II)
LNQLQQKVHLWLEDKSLFDLGNYVLEIVHTPGHTSGSICIYEVTSRLLFSGDTVFSGGTLSYISESGSLGDYINSIRRLATLKVSEICPGHGRISLSPDEDMEKAVVNAERLLREEKGVEVAQE